MGGADDVFGDCLAVELWVAGAVVSEFVVEAWVLFYFIECPRT